MADPFGPLKALVDLAGPFLIAVALFALGLAGYAVLLALGRAGVLDDGTDVEGSSNDGADGPGAGETAVEGGDADETGADGTDDRPRRV
jgi:hypothetical protein